MSTESNAKTASLQVQLETLQSRITTHGSRLWQLPLSYVAVAGIVLSGVNKDSDPKMMTAALALVVLAGICLWSGRKRVESLLVSQKNSPRLIGIEFYVQNCRGASNGR